MLHFTCRRIGSVSACFQNLHVGILNLGDDCTIGLHILDQLTGNLHLGTCHELLYAFGKVGPVSLNHLLTIVVVGQPEGLLAFADFGKHIGDVASDGIGLCRRCIIGQSGTEFDGLGTSNLSDIGTGLVGACFQNLHVGILNLGDDCTIGLHILDQLTGNLHLGTCHELLYAFGKVGPVSLNHLLTIVVVGQPEGLLAIADSGNHIGDVASDGIGLCRKCIVGQSCTEFNGLGTGNLYHLCRGLITTARIWIWIRCWNIIATACQSEYANKGKRHNLENLFHNYVNNIN